MPKRATRRRNPGDHPGVVGVALRLGTLSAADLSLPRLIDSHIERVLEASDGNRSTAALALGMHRRSLQRTLNVPRRVSRQASPSTFDLRIGIRRRLTERSMREKSLEDRVYAVVSEAASVITEIVRAELATELQKVVSARGPKNGRRGRQLASAVNTGKRTGRRGKRQKIHGATLARVLRVIESTPGLRSEQIYKKLPLPPAVTKRVLAKLREEKRVKTKGNRRATTYAAA